jgi:biopolymer transport protein ExbD
MAMSGPSLGGNGDEFELNSTINTTPLVDVMLVLLIIFLIAVPVAISQVHVTVPLEHNQPSPTKTQDITVFVQKDPADPNKANIFFRDPVTKGVQKVESEDVLAKLLEKYSPLVPQPELHIRGDGEARYENVNTVVIAAQRAGIGKVHFVTQPEPGYTAAANAR